MIARLLIIPALLLSSAAHSEIEWLGENDQNHYSSFEVYAFAKAGGAPIGKIGAIVACREMTQGTSCPIPGTRYRSDDFVALDRTGFHHEVRVADEWSHALYGDHTAQTVATQNTTFAPLFMRAEGGVAMTYTARGGSQRHHGQAQSTGRIHFRVPGQPRDLTQRHYFVASGSFSQASAKTWGTRGWVSMFGRTDNGTVTNWAVNMNPDSPDTDIRQRGVLMPGLYTMEWGVYDEPDLSNRPPIDTRYKFEITFGRCDANDSRLTHEGATSPASSVDEAAQRALAEAWTRTLYSQKSADRDREWGGLIYETGPGTGKYRYTRPQQGDEGALSGLDLTRSFDRVDALGLCEGQNFQLVGQYHTHPQQPRLQDPILPVLKKVYVLSEYDSYYSHLSVADIDMAVNQYAPEKPVFTIYARGHNGETCGIHKYATMHGHVASPLTGPATEEQLVAIQADDKRRAAAQWIPLSAGTKPTASCTQDGKLP